mgnify:CR=1 FL=1
MHRNVGKPACSIDPRSQRDDHSTRPSAYGAVYTAHSSALTYCTDSSLGQLAADLHPLAEKGIPTARNFRASDNKLRYACLLTPEGIEAKTRVTLHFLQRKRAEYERLQAEIATLEAEVGGEASSDLNESPNIRKAGAGKKF